MTACKQKAQEGPLDRHIDLFVQRLHEQQFSPESVRAQVLHVADLSRWLHARKLSVDDLTAEKSGREQHRVSGVAVLAANPARREGSRLVAYRGPS